MQCYNRNTCKPSIYNKLYKALFKLRGLSNFGVLSYLAYNYYYFTLIPQSIIAHTYLLRLQILSTLSTTNLCSNNVTQPLILYTEFLLFFHIQYTLCDR